MNCSSEVHESVKYFQLVVYIPTFIVGLILNALALQSFCWKLRKWTETTIYMTSLALSDIMVLVTLPFKIYSYHYKWTNKTLCILVTSLYRINICTSIFIITCISIDRYIAIKYPFRSKVLRSPMKAAVLSAVLWIFTSLWSILFAYKYYFAYNEPNATKSDMVCFQAHFHRNSIFSIVPTVIVFVAIPLIIVTFCSVQIIQTLQQRGMSNAGGFSTRRTIWIIAANAVVFVVCFMPFNIASIVHVVMIYMNAKCTLLNQLRSFSQVAMCIANINCCLDGFCFYFVTVEALELSQNRVKQPKDPDNNQSITLSSL
ncbi:G-protein coupled receptor 35-like [Heterodontus francisci]|uniref:G-protein coupled receptor 35-like n=1 Tax=Heterodontus francisci TaxID=7792 RepID=UPI00355C092E